MLLLNWKAFLVYTYFRNKMKLYFSGMISSCHSTYISLIHFPILYVHACMSDALLMIAAVKFYSLIMDDPLTSIKVELQWSKNQNSLSSKTKSNYFFFSIKSNKNQFSFMWMYHYSLPSVVSFLGDLQVLQHF